MQEITHVRKFDGSTEPFSREKIVRSIQAAGASEAAAQEFMAVAYPQLASRSRDGAITSWAIKEEVSLVLDASDPAVARSYREYSKKRF